MKIEAGRINSILSRQSSAEDKLDRQRGRISLEERVVSIMSKVEEQYNKEESEEIISAASKLLEEYGFPKDIPVSVLENSDYDDARLLAFCQLVEEKRKTSN